jgi:hypothetical protein
VTTSPELGARPAAETPQVISPEETKRLLAVAGSLKARMLLSLPGSERPGLLQYVVFGMTGP